MIGLLVQYVGRMLWGAAVVHSLAPPNRRFTVPKQNRRFTVD